MDAPLPIIDARGVRKSFRKGTRVVPALNGVDLAVGKGELVGIMGSSGSGKSTFLYILGCLDQPSGGVYRFNGRDVSSMDDARLSHMRARQIGFVFQTFNLIPQFTVLENVALPLLYGGRSEREAQETARATLRRVGLGHRLEHRPGELSGGEMQRTAIARALAINPVLILADEPTGNLDSRTSGDILEMFCSINAQGATIVMVTHDKEVAKACSRVVRIVDGVMRD